MSLMLAIVADIAEECGLPKMRPADVRSAILANLDAARDDADRSDFLARRLRELDAVMTEMATA